LYGKEEQFSNNARRNVTNRSDIEVEERKTFVYKKLIYEKKENEPKKASFSSSSLLLNQISTPAL